MSINIVYSTDDAEFGFSLLADDEIIQRCASRYPADIDTLFWVDYEDEASGSRTVDRDRLLASIDTIISALKRESDLIPDVYMVDYEIVPGVPIEGSEGVSALWIEGQLYRIDGGEDRCVLQKLGIDDRNRSYIIEESDIRHLKEIHCDKKEPLRIRHGKRKTYLPANLRKLRRFVEGLDAQTFTKKIE
jgi:hypothetical protein